MKFTRTIVATVALTAALAAVPPSEHPTVDEGCLCDGGAYEVKEHPFIVHSKCPIHSAAPPAPHGDSGLREAMIRTAAQAMHDCTSHPDYPEYDEAPCCGTPTPALVNPTTFHKDADHEKGSRGVCWSCEPLAAAAVDALLAAHPEVDA